MDLKVKFDGEEIIITKPGTDFMLAYRKRPDSPTLKLTRSWVDPHIISPPRGVNFVPKPFRPRAARRVNSVGLSSVPPVPAASLTGQLLATL